MKTVNFTFVLVSLILIASLVLLSACSSSTPTTSAPVQTTAAAPATTSAPAAPATTSAPAKVYDLKFSYHTPEKASIVPSYLKPWTAAIEQASNGRIKITHYGGESLVKIQDQYDSLVSGLSDMALVELDVTPGRFPKTEFYSLPFLSDNPAVTAMAYYDTLQKYSVNDELKEVKLLNVVTISGNHYIGNKEVKVLADFKGQRMRSGAKIEAMIIEQLGATPIEIATSDMATSLERGMVDSEFLTISGWLSFGIKDVTRYRTQCSVFTKSWVICMNKKVWDSMPADLQKVIIDNCGAEKSGFYSAENDKLEAGAINAIKGSDKAQSKPGIYVLPDEEKANWKTALMPVWDKWSAEMESKKLPGKTIIDDMKAAIQKYSTK